jgi:CBS domain-containing protein
MGKRVQELMTERPRAVRADAGIDEAAQIMELEDVGALPVVDDEGRLLGIVTDRDIAVRAVSRGRGPSTPVGEVASNDLITVTPDDDLDAALDQMARHRVRRLPVVQGETLVGMLAQADVARNGNDKSVGEVVGLISTPNRGPRVEEARDSVDDAVS